MAESSSSQAPGICYYVVGYNCDTGVIDDSVMEGVECGSPPMGALTGEWIKDGLPDNFPYLGSLIPGDCVLTYYFDTVCMGNDVCNLLDVPAPLPDYDALCNCNPECLVVEVPEDDVPTVINVDGQCYEFLRETETRDPDAEAGQAFDNCEECAACAEIGCPGAIWATAAATTDLDTNFLLDEILVWASTPGAGPGTFPGLEGGIVCPAGQSAQECNREIVINLSLPPDIYRGTVCYECVTSGESSNTSEEPSSSAG
jgi:hypothetical protein